MSASRSANAVISGAIAKAAALLIGSDATEKGQQRSRRCPY